MKYERHMDPRKVGVLSFLLAAVIFAPSKLLAAELSTNHNTSVTVSAKFRYTFESEVENMPGNISINQSNFDVKYDTKAFGILPLNARLYFKHLDINENIPADLPASLYGRRFGVGAKFPVPFSHTDEHFIGIDVMPSWYSDDTAFTSSAFRVPFRAYLIYKPIDPNSTFVLIAGAQIDVEADTPAVPIIGFNYQPNARLDILLASTEPTISYRLDKNWLVFAEYDTKLDEYAITHAAQKGEILKFREAAFGGGLKFKIKERLEASLTTGLITGRRLTYLNTGEKVKVDSAPYIKVRLSVIF